MKTWGVVICGIGLFILLIALTYDPTIASGEATYAADRVVNIQRLQVQMMTFIGSISAILLGGIMVVAGYVTDAIKGAGAETVGE